jgi:hypothetical protein
MKFARYSAVSLLPLAYSATLDGRVGTCKDVTFKVSGLTQNIEISGFDLTKPDQALATLMDDTFALVPVNGSQTLAGTYCEPTVKNKNNGKLQVFFHGITSNRDYWSALGGTSLGFPEYQPKNYSWVYFAHVRGYPTLPIDPLGNGKSSHPDPVLVVQGPYE